MTDRMDLPSKLSLPLLATRFFLPPLPSIYISRPRLFKQLELGLHFPLMLISAAAGSGKTSLVSDWIRSQPDLSVCWLSLESSDNDWARFFRYLVTAWQKIFPQAGKTALVELGASPVADKETLLDALLNDLLAGQERRGASHALLVLDDYHRIEMAAIHQSVTYLVEHLPPGCHLAVLTRADPPLPLSRWRSRRQMLELRADDLRFTTAEAAEFLNRTAGTRLSGEQVEILEARTEGWSVGLQMAALALQARSDQGQESVEKFIQSFGGSHRFVLDYLLEEVLNQQPEEIQRFLLTTSPLDQFCGALCDALLEENAPYSQNMLERLEKANLFLAPLDDHRQWYRYHHLFADLLRIRLRQMDPGRISTLYVRAAKWFADIKLWREAILYATRADDFALGADLFEKAIYADGLEFLFSGMSYLIEPFPAQWLQDHPLLGLAKAVSMIEASQLEQIEPLLRSVESRIQELSSSMSQSEVLGMVYVVQSVAASLLGDSPWILASSRQITQLLGHDVKAHVTALINLGVFYYYEGKLGQTEAFWMQALEVSQANNYAFGILSCLDNLGRLYYHMGELKRAEKLFHSLLDDPGDEHPHMPRFTGAAQRDYSDLLREWNRLGEAVVMMTAGLELCEKWETISGQGLGYIHMGRILQAQGDFPGAAAMLQKAERLCQTRTVYPDLETIVQVFRAGLLLEQGDLGAAWEVLEACLQSSCCQHALHREWVLIAQARVLIRRGQPNEALALLAGETEPARHNQRGRNWLEMNILTALAFDASGERQQALNVLREGLKYAQPQGFIRLFMDEGEPMQRLLEGLRTRFPGLPLLDYIHALLRAFPARLKTSGSAPSVNDTLVEPLSVRELEILRLVCQGLSNQEIATQLVLSVGTVKTHIHNIFGKLGVRDRPQAIAKSSQLDLL